MSNREVRPWDLFNKNKQRAVQDVKDARLEICRSCEFFVSLTQQCLKCGCIMPFKTSLAEASCPIHKWEAVDDRSISFKDE